MSHYTRSQIERFANDEIKKILPLDDESVSQMVGYCISNLKTRDALYNHFVNLLGETPETFSFVTQFGDMLFELDTPKPTPEKPVVDPPKKTGTKSIKLVSANGSRTKIVRTKVVNKNENTGNWLDDKKCDINSSSSNKGNKQRLTNTKKGGTTTSELFDLTPKRQEKLVIKKSEQQQKLNNIDEIDGVLMKLEVMKSQASKANGHGDIRKCNCNATRHPLFEMYPNCLNCGKIICEKEGLQPCSFCGHSLMSNEEREEVMDILKREKEELEESQNKAKTNQHASNNNKSRKNVMKISLNNVGQNNFKVQEQFFKMIERKQEDERAIKRQQEEAEKEKEENKRELEYWNSIKGKDEELRKAEERLEMLLSFQDNGAERTKIIDNAADFEAPLGGSLWATPLERALQLKRQQKNAQKMSEREEQRSARGKRNVDVVIRDGKVILRQSAEVEEPLDDLSDDDEIRELKSQSNADKLRQFNEEASNYYDYDAVSKEYVKPIYLGDISSKPDEYEIKKYPELGSVVQLGSIEDQENALFSMVGV